MEVMRATFKALAEGRAILPLRPVMWLPEKARRARHDARLPGHRTRWASRSSVTSPAITAPTTTRTGAGPALRNRARAPAGADGRQRDHRHPHRGRQRRGNSGAGARRRARPGDPGHGHAGADAPGGHASGARSIRRVRVWSRNADNVREFAERETRTARHHGRSHAPTAQAAVAGADLICTTTWRHRAGADGRVDRAGRARQRRRVERGVRPRVGHRGHSQVAHVR